MCLFQTHVEEVLFISRFLSCFTPIVMLEQFVLSLTAFTISSESRPTVRVGRCFLVCLSANELRWIVHQGKATLSNYGKH